MSKWARLLTDVIEHQLQQVELGFIAEIITFDKDTMRAEVRPLLTSKTEEDGADNPKDLDIPNIENVAVELIYGGTFYIRPNYTPGTLVKCACTASSLEPPLDQGVRSNMLDARFSLSNITVTGAVLPTDFEAPASWAGKDGLLIGDGDTILEVKADGFEFTGDVSIEGALNVDGDIDTTGGITATGDIEATGDVTAGPLGISLLTHTHPTTAPGAPTGPPLP